MQILNLAEVVSISSKDGTSIALWKRGTGSLLLAVHGTAADHISWDSLVPLLASDFIVYAISAPPRCATSASPTPDPAPPANYPAISRDKRASLCWPEVNDSKSLKRRLR